MATMTSPADPLTELCKSIGPVSRTLHLAYIPQTHSLPAREDSGFIQALHILPHDVRGLGALFTALFWCDSRSPCRAGSHVSVPSQKVVVQTPLSGRHSPGSGQRTREPRSGDHKRRACSGAQRGGLKPPVLSPRASDAGKCPHPGNPRRTAAAAATRSGRQNGGGSDGLVLRGEPGPRDPASGRAGWPQPPGVCPRPAPSRTPNDARGPGGRDPGRRGAGPRARSCCPEASLSPAGRSGAGAAGGAHAPRESLVGGAVAGGAHAHPRWRGSRGRCGPAGSAGRVQA